MKVLHYKSNFLNYSETFIQRLVDHHQDVEPAAMCMHQKASAHDFPIFEAPQTGINRLINRASFHLNWCLPFYTATIQKYQPDVIHAHFGFDGYRMMKPAQKAGVPLVVSFYGSDVSRLPTEFDWPRRYRKLAKRGRAFIAATQLMKKQLIDLGFPEQKITVIRFGLDLESFQPRKSYALNKPLMAVGRMVEKKGFEYALDAIRLLNKQGHAFVLDVYGDGILKPQLERRAGQVEAHPE